MAVGFTQEDFDVELASIPSRHMPVRVVYEICQARNATQLETLQAIVVSLDEYAEHYKSKVASLIRLAAKE